MEAISQSVSRLQATKEAIEQELADIASRFKAIEDALNAGADGAKEAKLPAETSKLKPAAPDGGKADGATKKGRKANH
jgi:hypothetical protein